MAFPEKKLRTKLMMILLGLVLVPFILVMSQAILKFQGIQKENAISQERRIALFVEREIAEFVSLQFAQLDHLENIDSFIPASFDLRQRFLEQLLFAHGSFTDIAMVNAEGRETGRVNRLVVISQDDLRYQGDDQKFLAIREGDRFISPLFWEQNRLFFIIGQGIFNAYNVFQGAIFVQVDARVMQDVVNELSIVKEGGRAYIVDQSGTVVAHPDISQVLRQENFSFIPLVSSLIKQQDEASFATIYRNELDQEVLGAGTPITVSFREHEPHEMLETNWFVIAEIPTFIALSAMREITLFIFLVLAVVLLFAVIAAFLLARQIVQPIEGLHQVSREFGRGNLDYRIPIHTGDEIEDLAHGFYDMSVNLKKSFVDITKSNEMIAVEKQRMVYMLNSLYDGLIAYDLEGRITAFNPRAEELLWVSSSDVMGKKAEELDPAKNSLLENIKAISSVILGDFEKRELAIVSPQERVFEIIMVPLVGEGKERVGVMRIIHDITKEKEVEHLKRNFVTTVSHQLRTPLSGIKWMIDMFIAGDFGLLKKDQRLRLQDGQKSVDHLISMVGDLLDISKIEEGKMIFKLESFDIAILVKELILETEGITQRDKKKLMLIVSEKQPLLIESDHEKLKIVLRNIIDNAIRYTREGGQVAITISKGMKSLLISVADNGIGIPKKEQKYLFTKFFRASNAVQLQTEGSGLGLFIAQQMVIRLNGRIIVESEEGKGSTFVVQLPLV